MYKCWLKTLPTLLFSVPFPDIVPLSGCGQSCEAMCRFPAPAAFCWEQRVHGDSFFFLPQDPLGFILIHSLTCFYTFVFPLSLCSSALHLNLLCMALIGMLSAISLFSFQSAPPDRSPGIHHTKPAPHLSSSHTNSSNAPRALATS